MQYAREAVRYKVFQETVARGVRQLPTGILQAEQGAQVILVRDLFNPFHARAADHAWLAWNDGTLPKLAQVIYDERRFDSLPIIADALEEAGCTHAAILAHCRGPGPHVRGCWVVDLLLGKA
jgi:hypothetical protein